MSNFNNLTKFLQKHVENERTLNTLTPIIKSEEPKSVTKAQTLSKMISEHKAKKAGNNYGK